MTDDRSKTPSTTAGGVAQRAKAADRSAATNPDRARSDQVLNDDALVDEASQDSFPASDPPSFMVIGSPGRPQR